MQMLRAVEIDTVASITEKIVTWSLYFHIRFSIIIQAIEHVISPMKTKANSGSP